MLYSAACRPLTRISEGAEGEVAAAAAAAAAATAATPLADTEAIWAPDALAADDEGGAAAAAAESDEVLVAATSLDRKVSPVPAYSFDAVIAAQPANKAGAQMKKVLQVLKDFKVPSATLGVQFNPNPAAIAYSRPATWRRPQYWLMYGFGMSYKAPMRVASVSKPLTVAVWKNNPMLKPLLGKYFFSLWREHVDDTVQPGDLKDPNVRWITITHLINHKSGFTNEKIGYDPAFKGVAVEDQMNTILKNKELAAYPGFNYSYSNFGFMTLAKLAEGITGKSFNSLVRDLFPASPTPPVFAASDSVAVTADQLGPGNPGAAEPGTYYVQGGDGTFDVTPMAGNGNIVTNVATLSWFGTQYWLLGETTAGQKFITLPAKKGAAWIMDGSMPGTIAVLTQWINQASRPACFAVIVNTRPKLSDDFLNKLNAATLEYLTVVFNATAV
ncbi:hypothetical protein OEZ86_010450 [Tetradesmus obliquus]|nr:hypothetical protein OEZ86_010450 [Tetradesmus obliquus]